MGSQPEGRGAMAGQGERGSPLTGAASRWGVRANKKVTLGSKAAQTGGFGRLAVRLFPQIHFFLGLGCKASTKQPKMSKNGKI